MADSTVLVTVDRDGDRIHLIDGATMATLDSYVFFKNSEPCCCAVKPKSNLVVVGVSGDCDKPGLYVFEVDGYFHMRKHYELKDKNDYHAPNSLAFSSDGKLLAVGTAYEKVAIYDTSSKNVTHWFCIAYLDEGLKGAISSVRFSNDNRFLIAGDWNFQYDLVNTKPLVATVVIWTLAPTESDLEPVACSLFQKIQSQPNDDVAIVSGICGIDIRPSDNSILISSGGYQGARCSRLSLWKLADDGNQFTCVASFTQSNREFGSPVQFSGDGQYCVVGKFIFSISPEMEMAIVRTLPCDACISRFVGNDVYVGTCGGYVHRYSLIFSGRVEQTLRKITTSAALDLCDLKIPTIERTASFRRNRLL